MLRGGRLVFLYQDADRSDRKKAGGCKENCNDSCRHERASFVILTLPSSICIKRGAILTSTDNPPASGFLTVRIFVLVIFYTHVNNLGLRCWGWARWW